MIDIIIPCYNAHDTVCLTLNSIVIQSIKDKVKVLLVNDASTKGYDDIVNQYKKYIDISVLDLKVNKGAGVARDKGIQKTSSKYIVFLDADDYLINANSLEILLNKIEEGYDLVATNQFDEKKDQEFINHGDLHGKIYRREYIIKENIHFNESRVHEDNFFNSLVILSGAKLFNDEENCTYYYSNNSKSISNSGSTELDRLPIYFENFNELTKLYEERKYSKTLYLAFVANKFFYLRGFYKTLNEDEKNKFDKIIEKYCPVFEGYKNLKDKKEIVYKVAHDYNYLDF